MGKKANSYNIVSCPDPTPSVDLGTRLKGQLLRVAVLKRVKFFSKMSDYFEGLSNKAKNRYQEKLQAVDLGIQDDPYKPEKGSRRKTSTSAA